jgi:sensor histidine kinase YesM
MFLAYSLMYWAIPKLLLRGKYVATALAVGFLFLATAFLSSIIGMYVLLYIRTVFFDGYFAEPNISKYVYIFPAMMAGLRGALTIGGMAAAIKLMKYWYIKEQRNMQLQKQNMEAQLQLLKAQVHPHFLFNTLNNIYSFTQNTSPVASRLVIGLSEMLRYML